MFNPDVLHFSNLQKRIPRVKKIGSNYAIPKIAILSSFQIHLLDLVITLTITVNNKSNMSETHSMS